MRNRFPGHYRPSDADFKKLWSECLFVPDANILLHLFRYGEKTRAQVFDTLKRLVPRIWIPYRVGFEFQRRWRDVDQTNRDAYEKLTREIETEGRKLGGLFNEYTRHQTIDVKKEQQTIDEFIKDLCKRLSESKENHPTREDAEKIFGDISDLIGDSVGERPASEQLDRLSKEAQQRYDNLVPPGYRDAKGKDGQDKYGDFFIWSEVLGKAKAEQKPIIVITDDVKEDWWQEFRGEKIGPRPELVEEMKLSSGQDFYLYTLSQFLDFAGKFLNRKPDTAAIEEIKSDELQRREFARQSTNYSLRFAPRNLERMLRDEQRSLRRRLEDIDARIEAIGETPEQLPLIPSLMRERRSVQGDLRGLARNIHDVRYSLHRALDSNDGRKYPIIYADLLQRFLVNADTGDAKGPDIQVEREHRAEEPEEPEQ